MAPAALTPLAGAFPHSNLHNPYFVFSSQTAAAKAYPSAGWDPAAQPSSLMMGVLSGDVRLAVRALRDYTGALSAEFVMPMSRVSSVQSA